MNVMSFSRALDLKFRLLVVVVISLVEYERLAFTGAAKSESVVDSDFELIAFFDKKNW